MENYTCSCGYSDGINHILGKSNCSRKLATGNLIPKNFRTINGVYCCDIKDYTITVYTLKNQRLYSQLSDGNWSIPKDEESTNSLVGEW